MRYQCLRYSIIFLVIIAILFLTSVFHQEFIGQLEQYSNNYFVGLYLNNSGANISMILILMLFIYSFLAQQKVRIQKPQMIISEV